MCLNVAPFVSHVRVRGPDSPHAPLLLSLWARVLGAAQVRTGRPRIAYRETLSPSSLPLEVGSFVVDRTVGATDDKPGKRLYAKLGVRVTALGATRGNDDDDNDDEEEEKKKEEDGDDAMVMMRATAAAAAAAEGRYGMNPATVGLSSGAVAGLARLPGGQGQELSEALRSGLLEALAGGPRHGFPVVGLHVEVVSVDGDGDTSASALRLAAEAFVKHLDKFEPGSGVLLQPVMALEVSSPEEKVGNVLSDLTVSRHAAIRGVSVVGAGLGCRHVVSADAPLGTLLGYASGLRSLTSGDGAFSMEYAHHAELDALPPEDTPKAKGQQALEK